MKRVLPWLLLAQSCLGAVGWIDDDREGVIVHDGHLMRLNETRAMSVSNVTIKGNVTYTNSYWDDATVSALQLNTGQGAPALEAYGTNGLKQMQYDTGDSSFGQIQLSHSYKRGTDVAPHIHWSSIDDRRTITNISFTMNAMYGKIHGTMTNYYTDTVTVTGTNAYLHNLTGFADFGSNVLSESAIIIFEVLCAEDGGTNDKVFIHDIDFHFQADKNGTDNELPD